MTKLATGFMAKDSADDKAKQLRKRAKATRAESTAEANEKRRQGRFTQSRAQAVAAASGASLSDPGFINIMGDIDADAEFRALTSMYEGEVEARGINKQATATKKEGRARLVASIFDQAESLAGKYG